MNDRLLGLLGISRKARKLLFGLDMVVNAAREGSVKIIFTASDASERTKQAVKNACLEYNLENIELNCTMMQLGGCIGRSSTAVVALTDALLAKKAAEICHAI